MTLVLAYANEDFVTIAVDRRIASVRDGQPVDDNFTKTAVVFNQFLVSFTGLAQIGPDQHTMEWFVKVAARNLSGFAMGEIADEATRVVKHIRAKRCEKLLAFVAVGYDDEGLITYGLISNMHADDGEVLAECRDDFICKIDHPLQRATIRRIGQGVPSVAAKDLEERLWATHGESVPGIDTVEQILAGAIEASASKWVSDTALVTTLFKGNRKARFDVYPPNAKRNQAINVASPYVLFKDGSIVVMPNQRLRRANRSPQRD
jgi:hypothetical protein